MRALPLLLMGCAPAVVHIPPPVASSRPAHDAIRLEYPVDVRLRADGGWFDGSAQVPVVVYGDLNLRPHPADALYRAVDAALADRGLRTMPDADWSLATTLIEWRGTRETSDARWVSTLNRGVAGWAGGFLYPQFMTVDALVRVAVRDEAGRTVVERDAVSRRMERLPARMAVSYMWLFTREPSKEAFTRLFAETSADLAEQIASIAADARKTGTTSVGRPIDEPPLHVFHSHSGDDTFSRLTDQDAVARATFKYGDPRMSVVTGHDLHRGDVVGRFSVPLDTLGYEVGVTERIHALIDLTVLGFYDRLSLGLRGRLAEWRGTQLSGSGWVGAQFVLLDTDLRLPAPGRPGGFDVDGEWSPDFAGWTAGGGAQVSHRYGDVTPFFRASIARADVRRAYPDLFPDLVVGSVTALTLSPGLEAQVTPTAAAAVFVRISRPLTKGASSTAEPFAPFVLLPSVSVGLR